MDIRTGVFAVACALKLACAWAGEWNFLHGAPLGGTVRAGAEVAAEGLRALCETNRGVQAGFVLDRKVPLTGAFTIEAEVVAGRHGQPDCPPFNFLSPIWDDLGASIESPGKDNCGVRLMLRIWKGTYYPALSLGYGDHIAEPRGPHFCAKPGDRVRIKVHFSANRRIEWDINGVRKTTYIAESGPALAGKAKPVIGDRACARQWPFTGAIRWVRVTSEPRQRLEVRAVSRRAFARDEREARVELEAENFAGCAVRGLKAAIRMDKGDGPVCETRDLGTLEPGARVRFGLAFCPRLRTGWRPVEVTLSGAGADGAPVALVKTVYVGVAPLHAPRMSFLITDSMEDIDNVAALGFNMGCYREIFTSPSRDDPRLPFLYDLLDRAAMGGIGLNITTDGQPESPAGIDPAALARVDRKGTPQTHRQNGKTVYVQEVGDPRMLDAGYGSWREWGKLLGPHPSFRRMLIHGEMRDHAIPSFAGEAARYRAETGRDIPPEVDGRRISRTLAHRRYPNGLVPEDDPLYAYYRWFWKGGDGWPAYITSVAAGLNDGVRRDDFETWWNPAVRCPPIWGSGGDVSYLATWVYPDPEPMQIAGPAEELLAMAAGRPGQGAIMSLQLMCYRRKVAPMGETPDARPDWLGKYPLTEFMAIAPDAFLEAVWSMMSKPMAGYTCYPIGSLIDQNRTSGYVFSNPELPGVVRGFMTGFAQPMGPMLLKLGREEPDVAVLESFTSAVMGMPHGSGWMSPAVTFLQRARLDPKVVYEEKILRDGFGGIKVLYAPDCYFLTQRVIDRIREFQKAGGILIADKSLNPQLSADVCLRSISFTPPPEIDQAEFMTDDMGEAAKAKAKTLAGKKAMQDLAETLRAKLVGRYAGRSDSSSPEIVTYNRRWKDVDYLFAVNDRRTFGDYFGQWGRTMEKGLPMAGFVTMRDSARSVKAVYELSRREKVPFTREGDSVKVPVSYDTCDGRLFAFLHQEIASVDLSCRREGDRIAVTMRVLDAGGRPVHALLPVEVRVHSSDGVEIDGAGYLVAEDGVARISVLTNRDDPKGGYRVTCRDLLTGNTRNVTVGGQPGMAPPPAAKAVPPARPAPRPVQLRRIADGIERYGIVHWGLNTFTDREWGFGDENPADLNPAKFDADQIVGACAAGGLQGLIVVAKHHDGFCLWPTKTTEHNITKSPFRGGNGDYVKEMEQACRRHGLRFGVYVSPWDRNNAHYGTDRYVTDVFQRQIRELLSGDYGEVFEMWFDGANGGDGYYGGAREKRKIPLGYYRYATETFAMVRVLQPNACIFNEMDEADFRYGGNERGLVDPDSRSTGGHYDHVWKNYKKWSNAGLVDGTTFHPVEADFPLRPGWFYHAGEKGRTKSAAYLMKLYLGTVGNAATMNVGVAPNRDGLLDDEDVRALAGFGQLRRLFFSREAKDGEPFNLVVMTEDVSAGERVDGWRLVADGKALLSGRSIGIKRIRTLGSPVTAAKVEVAAESAVGAVGKIGIARYLVDPSLLKEVLSSTTESGETDTAKWMTACSLTPGG